MSYARNLKFPTPAQPKERKSARREAGTYTTTDSPVVEYQKRHGTADTRVLTALAERHNFTRKAPLTVAAIQVETDLGQRAVEKALKVLEAAGFCHPEGRTWRYGASPANARANGDANGNANDCTYIKGINAVQYGKFLSLKEVEGSRRNLKENNHSFYATGFVCPPQVPPVAVGAEISSQKIETRISEPQTPDGVASGEAHSEARSFHSQEKNESGKGETINVTDSEIVPPAAAPTTYREAQTVLATAGAWDVWANWAQAHRQPAAAQNAQVVQFAGWTLAGLTTELRQNAAEITAAGSFNHPYPALVKRMERVQAVRDAANRNASEGRAMAAQAVCQPGQRRRAPSGQVFTVEEVTCGSVIFEEPHAPQDVPDRVAALWEVLA